MTSSAVRKVLDRVKQRGHAFFDPQIASAFIGYELMQVIWEMRVIKL